MNLNETKRLLVEVAAIDNRKLDEAVAQAWHSIIGNIPFDIAQEALRMARKDDRVNYLEPKHIVGWAREAAFKLDKEKPKVEVKVDSKPMPVCKAHKKSILLCDPCCHRMSKYVEAHGVNNLEQFAKQEIYE